jgi:hypothetical protein
MFQMKSAGRRAHPVRLFRVLSVSLLVWTLSGCGSSGENSSGTDTPASENESNTAEAQSSAMADHQVSSKFSYELYRVIELSLDLSPYAASLAGDHLVVKVYDRDQTYFLGYRKRLDLLQLSLSLPRHAESVWIEVSGNDPSTGSIVEEVLL